LAPVVSLQEFGVNNSVRESFSAESIFRDRIMQVFFFSKIIFDLGELSIDVINIGL
jgi:hypothetical protein